MSPLSRGRKPKKRPKNQRIRRARPPTDVADVRRWSKLLREPVELSGCVVQGEPDEDTVTLAATLTAGKRSVGIEVMVNEEAVDVIEVHAAPADATALRRRAAFELAEAPLSPDEFRSQIEAALVVKADTDRWFAEHVPGLAKLGSRPRSDLPERMTQLRLWLGLPEYEPVPRMAATERRLSLVLPPLGPAVGFRIAVGLAEVDTAIWRRLEVRSDSTLAELHRILAVAFDRDERSGHRFETAYGGFGAGEPGWDGERPDDEVTLGQVAPKPGHRLVYEQESWSHWLRVEQVIDIPAAPRCVDGERAAPPRDCEDVRDYEMALEALADPDDEDNAPLLEEFGVAGGFDPEWFDPVLTNARLAGLG